MNKRLLFVLLLSVAALLVALAAGSVFGQGDNGLEKANQAKERHADQLLAIEGVVGAGVGHNPDGAAAVVVYTTRPGVAVPKALDDVPVESVVTGLIVARSCQTEGDPTQRCDRPVPIGVSTGHPNITPVLSGRG